MRAVRPKMRRRTSDVLSAGLAAAAALGTTATSAVAALGSGAERTGCIGTGAGAGAAPSPSLPSAGGLPLRAYSVSEASASHPPTSSATRAKNGATSSARPG